VTTLTFTPDSRLLLTSSLDSSVHVYLVSRLLDPDESMKKPYGTLNDHTLGITDVVVSRTSGAQGGRCWTAGEDGTVKLWSLHAPFNLLTTFALPAGVVPSTLAVEAAERFFYVGTRQGEVFHIPLYKRRGEIGGGGGDDIEAIGGGGQGAAAIKTEGSVIIYKCVPPSYIVHGANGRSPITALSLSLSATHLLVGTQSADIHIHSLPSHQHLRSLSSHAGPITYISTLLRPPDLVSGGGATSSGAATSTKSESWPIMDIKPLERMRMGKPARDVQEVTMMIRPGSTVSVDSLRPPRPKAALAAVAADAGTGDQLAEVMAENKRLRASLEKAVKINDKMWEGIVDLHLLPKNQVNGDQ